MRYDLKDPFQREQAATRMAALVRRGAVVELSEKRQRTLPQNAYLHLILGWFAIQVGVTREYCKQHYFKEHVNPDIFLHTIDDPVLHTPSTDIRSTASLSKEELSRAIERFRNFAALDVGYYIPSPDEAEYINQMENEVSRYSTYL